MAKQKQRQLKNTEKKAQRPFPDTLHSKKKKKKKKRQLKNTVTHQASSIQFRQCYVLLRMSSNS
jgi:hypothetical protein